VIIITGNQLYNFEFSNFMKL